MNDNWGHFADFTEEQFAANENFQRWVLIPDDENETFWLSFLQNHPDQKISVSNARKLVEHLTETGFHMPHLTAEEKQELRDGIFLQIEKPDESIETPRLKKSPKKIWLAAAALTGFAALTGMFLTRADKPAVIAYATHTTAPKEIKEIILPDSSVVILNGNSSIKYNSAFTGTPAREVVLNGNAYFKIKKSGDQQPFIVHANQLNIRVTGTEFNVDARSRATDVVLTKGNINISMNEDGDANHRTFLNAGEKFRLDTLNREFITEKADTELYTAAWDNGEWHFDATSLEQISVLIKQFYGTEVLFKNNEAQKLMITAVVSVHDLSTLIQVIEKTLNLTIEETPNSIIII